MPSPRSRDDARLLRAMPGWARLGSVAVRAVHLTSCAAILGAALVDGSGTGLGAWWAAAALSGLLLLAYEAVAHRGLWRLLAGWLTALKLALLLLARLVPASAVVALLAAFAISAIGAHLPRRWRHRALFGPADPS